jgi:hypothetical protein
MGLAWVGVAVYAFFSVLRALKIFFKLFEAKTRDPG